MKLVLVKNRDKVYRNSRKSESPKVIKVLKITIIIL